MIMLDHDRRSERRISLSRPCKVCCPRSLRYVSGSTCDVSSSGMLLRLSRSVNFEPGDRLFLGVAQKRRQTLLRSNDMIETEVIRTMPTTAGETYLAVSMKGAAQGFVPQLRRAA